MNISLLIPRSVLYPSMGFDIVDGIRAGLQHGGASAPHFDIRNIGVAAKDQDVFTHCEQALMNGADIVVAYINPSSAEYAHALFEANDKLLLVLDSGMHFPPAKKLSHAFFISLQGILCCRLTAKLAVDSGFDKNAFTCSFYDAGYRAPVAFASSVGTHGGSISFNHITPLKRSEFTVQPLVDFLAENTTNGVLAAFAGDMAEDFYKHGEETGLFQNNAIFGSPYMIEEVWLDKIPYPGGKTTACSTWARSLDLPENHAFMQALNKPGKANVFSVIAWEAGLFLAAALSTDSDSISTAWSTIVLDSPRGKVSMNSETNFLEAPVYICQVINDSGKSKLTVLSEVTNLDQEISLLHKDVLAFGDQVTNSWHNAYPCLES